MKALYNLFLLLYPLGAKVLSITNEKARKWLAGRKNIFENLSSSITNDKPIIWIHCSSLGEFEQGKPLIERLRLEFSNVRILLTFFSPSGYEVQKDYPGADWVSYLPMDSATNATRFFDIVKPSLIIFIKYEFWHYYISEAKRRNVPILLASAVFRENQPFFQWYGDFHRKMLQSFTYLFVQDKHSVSLLNNIQITNVAMTGDTRFDRVLAIAKEFQPINIIGEFCGSHPVIVAGSTWTDDDEELDHYANTNRHIRFIIAPHDISKARIDECRSLYKYSITLSAYKDLQNNNQGNAFASSTNDPRSTANVLIIDNIGILSKLYNYASIAYVGGGFGADGVHNVLEAAVYGKPVVFGPEYDKYIEAVQLEEAGGAFSIESAVELEMQFNELFDDEFSYKQACIAAKEFVAANAGATEKIIQFIQEKRLFTIESKSLTV